MFEGLRDKIISKLFVDSFKNVEKLNWCTSALKASFKGIMTSKKIWNSFIDSVIGLMKDAIDEAEQARSWANEEEE